MNKFCAIVGLFLCLFNEVYASQKKNKHWTYLNKVQKSGSRANALRGHNTKVVEFDGESFVMYSYNEYVRPGSFAAKSIERDCCEKGVSTKEAIHGSVDAK